MDVVPQALLFLGVIPALILLFITLKGYDEIYKEKTMFLMFIAGVIIGIVSIIIESVTSRQVPLIVFFTIYPFLEQTFKTVVLNLRRFQGKKVTPIYGLSLGVGFGSVFTPYLMIVTSGSKDPNIIYLAFAASLGVIIINGATGVLIGYGVYTSELTKYLISSVLLTIPIPIFFIVPYAALALIPYGLILYWYSTMIILPRIKTKSRKRAKKT